MPTLAAALVVILAQLGPVVELEWPFETGGWVQLETGPAHHGDDRFAQDWVRSDGATDGRIVLAPLTGRIVQAEWSCVSYGMTIVIWDEAAHRAVRMAHLSRIDVSPGDAVRAGDRVGIVGRTGPAPWCPKNPFGSPTLAHLHIVAYMEVIDPAARPVSAVGLSGVSPYAERFRFPRDRMTQAIRDRR
jgi:hypothetical protein